MENEVLQELWERYYASALLYCLALGADRATAEDMVSDAFVKAYLSLPDAQPSFQYWLLRVCKNLWFDRLRREKRWADLPAELVLDEDMAERLFQTERSRALWRCVCALAPSDREIVTLHYYGGIPLGEIARSVGKTPTAIRQRLVRLRRRIKEEMEEQGYGI